MSQDQVSQLLSAEPESAKVIGLNNGRRYRIRGSEKWLAGPCLVILHRRDLVHISYRNIASIRVLQPRRKAE